MESWSLPSTLVPLLGNEPLVGAVKRCQNTLTFIFLEGFLPISSQSFFSVLWGFFDVEMTSYMPHATSRVFFHPVWTKVRTIAYLTLSIEPVVLSAHSWCYRGWHHHSWVAECYLLTNLNDVMRSSGVNGVGCMMTEYSPTPGNEDHSSEPVVLLICLETVSLTCGCHRNDGLVENTVSNVTVYY